MPVVTSPFPASLFARAPTFMSTTFRLVGAAAKADVGAFLLHATPLGFRSLAYIEYIDMTLIDTTAAPAANQFSAFRADDADITLAAPTTVMTPFVVNALVQDARGNNPPLASFRLRSSNNAGGAAMTAMYTPAAFPTDVPLRYEIAPRVSVEKTVRILEGVVLDSNDPGALGNNLVLTLLQNVAATTRAYATVRWREWLEAE